jgi:hypothetical protein
VIRDEASEAAKQLNGLISEAMGGSLEIKNSTLKLRQKIGNFGTAP